MLEVLTMIDVVKDIKKIFSEEFKYYIDYYENNDYYIKSDVISYLISYYFSVSTYKDKLKTFKLIEHDNEIIKFLIEYLDRYYVISINVKRISRKIKLDKIL
jgi:hypothetical protein